MARCNTFSTAVTLTAIFSLFCSLHTSTAKDDDHDDDEFDFYKFTVMDIRSNIVSLEQYRGKVSLVVNVASYCGYTDQHYKSLVRLQELLEETGKFNVLAFPCNQFGNQEPGSNAEIFNFGLDNYDVNFPMFAKVDVKGHSALDAWRYLNDKFGREPDWNFWKYLVDHNGRLVKAWGPWMDPDKLFNALSNAIDRAIAAELNAVKEAEQNNVKKQEQNSAEDAAEDNSVEEEEQNSDEEVGENSATEGVENSPEKKNSRLDGEL